MTEEFYQQQDKGESQSYFADGPKLYKQAIESLKTFEQQQALLSQRGILRLLEENNGCDQCYR